MLMSYTLFSASIATNSVSQLSKYAQPIVVYDPPDEQYSVVRWSLVTSVIITSIVMQAWLLQHICACYYCMNMKSKAKSNALVTLLCLVWLAVVVHSVHFVDNLIRPVSYFTPYWIHRGILVVEDITALDFMFNLLITHLSISHILIIIHDKDKQLEIKTDARYYSKMSYSYLGLHFLCVNLWFGLAHFTVEPVSSFRVDCICSIFAEAFCGFMLQSYLLVSFFRQFCNDITNVRSYDDTVANDANVKDDTKLQHTHKLQKKKRKQKNNGTNMGYSYNNHCAGKEEQDEEEQQNLLQNQTSVIETPSNPNFMHNYINSTNNGRSASLIRKRSH